MILVTGATGFVGSAVLRRLSTQDNAAVLGSVRKPVERNTSVAKMVCVGDLTAQTDWSSALQGVKTVIHTAARVHVIRDTAQEPLDEFRRINVAGSLRLAQQAAEAGVRRFIFLSSIKVNGEETEPGRAFAVDDAPNPLDAYGISKLEAELGLKRICAASGMELVTVRPPLVYGPGVKANFFSMMTWLYRGVPLPLGAITRNRRSLIALENLVDLIVTCVDHPSASNRTFLASDEEDLSTAELLMRMGAALGKRLRLIPVSPAILMSCARLTGRDDLARRLLGSLQIDASKTRALLGWHPPASVDDALERTARHFLEQVRR